MLDGIRPLALLTYALENAPDKVRFMDFRSLVRQVRVKTRQLVTSGFRPGKARFGTILSTVTPDMAQSLRDPDGDVFLLVQVSRDVYERAKGGIIIPAGVDL
jgi:hypothetical protein